MGYYPPPPLIVLYNNVSYNVLEKSEQQQRRGRVFFEESTTSLGSESTADLQSRSSSLQNIIATESHNELNQGRSRKLTFDNSSFQLF